LRIFSAVRHSNDPRYYYGGLWSGNFYPALRALGHEIVESQVDLLSTSQFMDVPSDFTPEEREVRAVTTQRILDEVRAAHRKAPIDLFLSYFYNSHFDPAGFDDLRRLGIPSINFFGNACYQFDLVAELAPRADFAWHAERDVRSFYLAVGANPVWVQFATDPDVFSPRPDAARIDKAFFVGQKYVDRDRWMAALVSAGLPVDIYGAGWGAPKPAKSNPEPKQAAIVWGRRKPVPGSLESYLAVISETIRKQGLFLGATRVVRLAAYRKTSRKLTPILQPFARGFLPFERLPEFFSAYGVSLNFTNIWSDGRAGSAFSTQVRMRDFEAPMAGACYLTGYSQELEDFYEIGREVDTYRTTDELVDKTRFYLSNGAAADRLRRAGHARARRDHTWIRRFEELFQKTGIGK
jgi:spore maturation protein CgeB